jgi:hypothetical protein
MNVNETFLFTNNGKMAWSDPDRGTLHFFLPTAAGKAQVNGTAPGGMPIPVGVLKTSQPDVAAVDFAVKPGDTRFDVTYSLPYTTGAPYPGKIVTKDENTYLIAPNGITMAGDGLNDLGTEPRTQAHIFGFSGSAYKVTFTGSEAAPPAASNDQPESSGPQIETIMPRIYGKAPLLLALAFAILAVGFAMLYRTPTKESK